MGVRENLYLIIDEVDHGLFWIDEKWVNYVSMINTDELEKITDEWFRQMQKQYQNEILEVTQSAIDAIKDLHELCEVAIKKRKTVFVEPRYDYATECTDGYYRVKVGDKWGRIDSNGDFVIKADYKELYGFSEGLVAAKLNGKLKRGDE